MKTNSFKKARLVLFIVSISTALMSMSCEDDNNDDDKVGNWIVSTVFDGTSRSNAVTFIIGNKGYMGTGYDGDDYLNDFWEYDFEGGYWVQKANFPGESRSSAVGFNANNYGFIGTGYNGSTELKDFYRYNPATNVWNQISDFGGQFRRGATAFNSINYGFVGCGFDGSNDKKDFWKYDSTTDSWVELIGFGGNKRRDGSYFKIDNNIYFGFGKSNGINQKDFWKFNVDSETWTRLRDLDYDDDYNLERSNAIGFNIGEYGYICNGTPNASVWEYNPQLDEWIEKTGFEGITRQDASSFSYNNRAYVFLGRSINLYFDDMYEFMPFEEYDDED